MSENASLSEIIAAAEAAGVPVVMEGQVVNDASAEKVDVEPPKFTGSFQRAPIDTPGQIQFPHAYATSDPVQERPPLTSLYSGYCTCAPIGDGLTTFSRDCGILRHRVLAAEGKDILGHRETPVFGTGLREEYRETDAEPTKQREGDQVLPTASRDLPVAHEEVIKDLQERLRIGVERYGQGLRPFNGRNTLQDEYEELLDQVAYKKTQLLMREATFATLVNQVYDELDTQFGHMFLGRTRELVMAEIAGRIVNRILDCFTGFEPEGQTEQRKSWQERRLVERLPEAPDAG